MIKGKHAYLPHDLVVLQNAPGDVDAIVIPICPGHIGVDVRIDACHAGSLACIIEIQNDEFRRRDRLLYIGSGLVRKELLMMWAEGCWLRSELGSEAQVSSTKRKATPTVTNGKA